MNERIHFHSNHNECFRSYHVRYLNPDSKNPNRVVQLGKESVAKLSHEKIVFLESIKDYHKIED